MIRLNPVPWLFAPGIALAGYALDDLSGAFTALAGWLLIVTAATVCDIMRGHDEREDETGP